MSLEVDGAAILKALAKNPRAFAMGKADVNMIATSAITARLKKGVDLRALRSIVKAIGHNDFCTIVGDLPDKDARNLARLDAGHADHRSADVHWHRARIIDLAAGTVNPKQVQAAQPRIAPAKEMPVPRLPKIGKIMASAAQATATRARKPPARVSKGRR